MRLWKEPWKRLFGKIYVFRATKLLIHNSHKVKRCIFIRLYRECDDFFHVCWTRVWCIQPISTIFIFHSFLFLNQKNPKKKIISLQLHSFDLHSLVFYFNRNCVIVFLIISNILFKFISNHSVAHNMLWMKCMLRVWISLFYNHSFDSQKPVDR